MRVASRNHLILITLAVLLGLVGLGSLLVGAASLEVGQILRVGLDRLGFDTEVQPQAESVLVGIRLPRALATVFVGYGLGVVGAALQGVFHNPLADSHLLGIAPAAGLGALVGYALTPSGATSWVTPVIIVSCSALAGLVFALYLSRLTTNAAKLSLIGAALSFGATAWLGAIVLVWDNSRVPTLLFWIFGGFTGATWRTLYVVAPVIVLAAVALQRTARALDILALGEVEARHLGVPVRRARHQILAVAGVAVGAAVAMAGVIGFIGLVAPNLVRRFVGPGHQDLLIGSGLAGAVLLLLADTCARTVANPTEIPVGLLTGMVGAPIMAWTLIQPQFSTGSR